jgi:hypothetical protein
MSFATSFGPPASAAFTLLRGRTLPSMARAVGVILGAALLAATYQFAYEESRSIFHSMRVNSARRQTRNDALMLILLRSALPIETQELLCRSRDTVTSCMRMLTNPTLPVEQHILIHSALCQIINGTTHEA